jgi:hypothetical protein
LAAVGARYQGTAPICGLGKGSRKGPGVSQAPAAPRLNDIEDIAVGVLEPRRLEVAQDVHVAVKRDVRQLVVLEADALAFNSAIS